jgi:hypothetical protein
MRWRSSRSVTAADRDTLEKLRSETEAPFLDPATN